MIRQTYKKDLETLNRLYIEALEKDQEYMQHLTPWPFWDLSKDYFEADKILNTWENVSYTSFNQKEEIIGHIKFSLERDCSHFTLCMVAFDKKNSFLFMKDVIEAIDLMFKKYQFDSLTFVTTGEMQKRLYRKFVEKCGGRVVGYFIKSDRCLDQKLYNKEMYEILRENWKRP